MLRIGLLTLGTFSISFASMWLFALVMTRTGAYAHVRERRPVDSMFDPDLLAW
jgi:hypothetical protein